jgi:hypothetical protein
VKTTRLALIVLLVTAVLASCAKRDTSPPANSGEPTTTTTVDEATTTTEAAASEPSAKVALKASEYAYEADNLTFPAGPIEVTLGNGGLEEHQATIVRFKEGKTLADLAAIAESDPAKLDTVIDAFGGPTAVGPDGVITTTQTLEAGDYVFMCFIPAPDGVPHAAKGMAAPFTVTEGDAAADPQSTDNTLSLKEYEFGFDDGDTIPSGTYSFSNDGTQIHEAAIYKPADGKTIDDVLAALQSETPPTGDLPYEPAGGLAATNPGTSVQTELEAGDYVFVCFLPDKSDGAPHFTKGMLASVTVEDGA